MASDHRVGGEEMMSNKQAILKDYVQWLSKRIKPVRTSRQVASIKLEAPEEESGKDPPPGKQPHVLSSSQRWNCTDLLICKVPKNLDLFSKK